MSYEERDHEIEMLCYERRWIEYLYSPTAHGGTWKGCRKGVG